ncbi:MAG: hypothetical protein AAFR35_09635 [Pseudomonadota bacterium]
MAKKRIVTAAVTLMVAFAVGHIMQFGLGVPLGAASKGDVAYVAPQSAETS